MIIIGGDLRPFLYIEDPLDEFIRSSSLGKPQKSKALPPPPLSLVAIGTFFFVKNKPLYYLLISLPSIKFTSSFSISMRSCPIFLGCSFTSLMSSLFSTQEMLSNKYGKCTEATSDIAIPVNVPCR